MMKIAKLLTLTSCFVFLFSCKKTEVDKIDKAFLREEFNGKYELISSISDIEVDLNNDGISSANLLYENSMINFASVEIRVPDYKDFMLEDDEFVYSEYWPVENERRFKKLDLIEVIIEPTYAIHNHYYDYWGVVQIGRFQKDFSANECSLDLNHIEGNTLLKLELIKPLEEDIIEVTTIRKLYTSDGWVTAKIISKYKRYTTIA